MQSAVEPANEPEPEGRRDGHEESNETTFLGTSEESYKSWCGDQSESIKDPKVVPEDEEKGQRLLEEQTAKESQCDSKDSCVKEEQEEEPNPQNSECDDEDQKEMHSTKEEPAAEGMEVDANSNSESMVESTMVQDPNEQSSEDGSSLVGMDRASQEDADVTPAVAPSQSGETPASQTMEAHQSPGSSTAGLRHRISTLSGWATIQHRWSLRKGHSTIATAPRDGQENLLIGDPSPLSDSQLAGEAGSHDAANSAITDAWLVVDREGEVVAEDGVEDITPGGSVEAKVEQLLTWMLAPAVHGIPKLGVPGAPDRASELLAEHSHDVEDAVREVVAGSERTVSMLVLNFCIERIPVLGCPTVLLRTTWGNLRSILIIAALYGHDLEAPRVQHEALLCLVPPGEEATSTCRREDKVYHQPALVGETAQKVARSMIKGALRRATGLQAAVDCFELASLLYSSCGHDAVDEDGFVHVMATPASAARDFFRRRTPASRLLLWCSLPMLVLGMAAPGIFLATKWLPTVARSLAFMAQCVPKSFYESLPAFICAIIGVVLTICGVCKHCRLGTFCRRRRVSPWFSERVLSTFTGGREVPDLNDIWPQILTILVFLLHAVLPAASTYSSMSMILGSMVGGEHFLDPGGWDMLHRLSSGMLGLYTLCMVLSNQITKDPGDTDSEPQGKVSCAAIRILNLGWAIARGCCVLAFWTYLSILLDLATTQLAFRFGSPSYNDEVGSVLGVIGPLAWLFKAVPGTNPLRSERAMNFSLNCISVASQQRLVAVLSRREVLLRLIGAERVTASTICLLLKGVSVACSSSKTANPIAEFFESVAPPPICCILVVALRLNAVKAGAVLALAPELINHGLGGNMPLFGLGLLVGGFAAFAVLSVWYENKADLDSAALRLALLIPGSVSSRAKGLLRGALAGARTRAVQIMAIGILDRVMRWFLSWRR